MWRIEGKRYIGLNEYFRFHFGTRVYKVPVDAGFSCPNRKSRQQGGCVYCSPSGSAAAIAAEHDSITEQVQRSIASLRRRHKARKFLAYFQAYSNTHAPVDELRLLYDRVLSLSEDFIGLSIGTRPDCMDHERLDLLESYQRRGCELWVEYGVQSLKEESLEFIRRGHDVDTALRAIEATRRRGIKVCAHVIFGLPTESLLESVEGVRRLGELGIDGIKIHMLHIMEGTELARMYRQHPFLLPTLEEYADAVAQAIGALPSGCILHRLTGDASSREQLVAPAWIEKKQRVLDAIDNSMARKGISQGDCLL
ncbi:conserved hypothetical protein [Desulfurispirillum indicum S5]|uniref:Radical SAM core domain-containing protein n=1 Tax=Desulfurispirillum indicum (strain ATCC BAA-1389 / DSM 22839 / S5) TaxID=653733 RepID=E6W2D1_DESIS|nr:TIGR01212 family radical SAM protein [Desulfurispirillum indicum]ADU66681.1 conserved hypothetical protein [Desulfurispirillum indicum S5]